MQQQPIAPFEHWHSDGNRRKISRPLIYALQHLVLPTAVHRHDPMLHQALSGPKLSMFGLVHMVSKSSIQCEGRFGWPGDVSEFEPFYDYRDQLLQYVLAERYEQSGCTNWVIRMPPPVASPEAHFVSVWNFAATSNSTSASGLPRYFTLEFSGEAGKYFVCEWDKDGEHRNYKESKLLTSDQFNHEVELLTSDA